MTSVRENNMKSVETTKSIHGDYKDSKENDEIDVEANCDMNFDKSSSAQSKDKDSMSRSVTEQKSGEKGHSTGGARRGESEASSRGAERNQTGHSVFQQDQISGEDNQRDRDSEDEL